MSYNKLTTLFDKQDEKTKLVITAAAASFITAGGILSYQAYVKKGYKKKNNKNKNNKTIYLNDMDMNSEKILPIIASDPNNATTGEQIIFSKDQWQHIQQQQSFVVIVGAGGVGSWAALMLLRAGIKKIQFIDFDQVTLSSLNGHAVATLDNVGTPKVMTMKRHFQQLVPQCDIDAQDGII
ncbi:unnamed protein product [Cunninghamella echinulata]